MFQMMSETIYPLFRGIPRGYAHIGGSSEYPDIKGMVLFYPYEKGTVVVADIGGLPMQDQPEGAFFGFHIHEGDSCETTGEEPFNEAGVHLDLSGMGRPHPQHTGDMPALLGQRGRAWSAFYTERFRVEEVRGKTVIIHRMPDDYRTQPSGNSGEKIACGVIR